MKLLTSISALALAAALTAACNDADREEAEADAERAANETGEMLEEAGEEIVEESRALGEAVVEGSKAAAERGSEVYREREAELDAIDDAEDAMETPSEYEPEIVDAFELGSKNRFLGNTVSLNAAAFYYQYEDMQFIQEDPIPFAGGIGNIPSANIWGLEMEGGWMLFDYRLRLGMNATLMDGEYPDEFEALDRRLADAAGDQAIADGTAPFEWSPEWFEARGSAATQLKGKTPPNLPELAGGVNATWYQDLADHGTLTSRVEYQYRGEYEARVFNTPVVDDVDSYWQMNLFLEYKPSMKPWRVWLTVTNLTDEDGVGARFVDPYGSGVVSNAFIPPRQLVANFGYTF